MAIYWLFHMIIYFILNISSLNSSLIIVCLEKNITETDAYVKMEYELHHLTDSLKTFDEEQECIDYISTLSLQTHPPSVYFILSDEFYDNIFPIIQQQQKIKTPIFMFAPGPSLGYLVKERKNEFYQVFHDHKCLISRLSKDLDTEENISMSIYIQDMKNVSLKCLDRESETFLLFQLLTSSFHKRQHDTTERNDFLTVYNQYNEGDISYLDQLYLFQDIIQWYSSDTFISRLLSEAFRTINISLIFKLRFFIINLLLKSFDQDSNIMLYDTGKMLTLYRKECITNEKLIKLRLNVNRLLSINEFYVTTLEKSNHILQQSESADMECVLFQFDIDTSTEITRPYVLTNNYESKILFTFGTVFQIKSVEFDTNTHIWTVKLLMNEEVENQVKDLIDQLGDRFGYPFDFMTMGQLFDEIREYSKAIECYRIFLDETSEDDEYVPVAYEYLGLSYYHNESYIEALQNYYKALTLNRLRSISSYDDIFVKLYKLIGDAYHARHQYAIAIDYYNEALRIQPSHVSFMNRIDLDARIANAYSKIGDHQKYDEYLGRTVMIKRGDSSYMMLSEDPTFKKTINYTTSLENFQRVLIDLLNNKSSATHQFDYDIVMLHYRIGKIYFKMEEYEQALDEFKKVVNIYLNVFPLTLSNLARNYDTITDTSILMLKNYLFKYELHFRFIPLRYSLLSVTYRYMARIYFLDPKYIETALNIHRLATAVKSIQQDF